MYINEVFKMVKKRRKSRKNVPRLKTHYSGGLPKRIIGSTARHYASMAMGIDPFTQTIIKEAIEELIREGYKINLDIDICLANILDILKKQRNTTLEEIEECR